MRCFVAVDVPPDVRARVAALTGRLRAAAPRADIRWVNAETLHVTLKFLGEVPDVRVPLVEGALATVAAAHRPLTLVAAGTGGFPTASRPRVVYVGILGQVEALTRLAAAVDGALEAIGFPGERRAFRGHLTVGRVRTPRGTGGLAAVLRGEEGVAAGTWTAAELVLYRSRLRPSGAVHEAIARLPLAGRSLRDP
jgi:2'-5' RNA ligase